MAELADPEIVALLQRISDQLEQLPKAIAAAQYRGAALTRGDRGALTDLLPAITRAIGNAPFTARDLLDEAQPDSELADALAHFAGDGGSARRLGKLLARANGFAHDDLVVERQTDVREGVLWRVSRV